MRYLMKCPKCNSKMVWKQRPDAAVGAGKQKKASAGRDWYCDKCKKFTND